MYKRASPLNARRNIRRGFGIAGAIGTSAVGSLATGAGLAHGFDSQRAKRLRKLEEEAALAAEAEAIYSMPYKSARFRWGAGRIAATAIPGAGLVGVGMALQRRRRHRLEVMAEAEAAAAADRLTGESQYMASLYRDARFTGWRRQGRVYGRKLRRGALGAGVVAGLGALGGYLGGRSAEAGMNMVESRERKNLAEIREGTYLNAFEHPEWM